MRKLFYLVLAIGLMTGFQAFAQPSGEGSTAGSQPEEGAAKAASDRTYDHFGINLNFWSARYTGTVEIRQTSEIPGFGTDTIGEELNLEDDFDLQNPQNIPEIELWFGLGKKNRIRLSYYTVNYGGKNKISEPIDFAGYQFVANSEIETTWKIDHFAIMHDWSFLYSEDIGQFGLSYGFEYYYWKVGFKGKADDGGGSTIKIDESQGAPIPIPVVGLHGSLNLPYGFGIGGTFTGMGLSLDNFEASYFNLSAGATYDWRFVHVGLSYRYLIFTLHSDDLENEDQKIDWRTNQDGVVLTVGFQI